MPYLDRVTYDNSEYLIRDSDSFHTVNVVSRFSGMKISILGDSMSTYVGYTYPGYPGSGYPGRGLTSVDETWWMKVINGSGASLEQNASVGGSSVTTIRSSYPDFYARCSALGDPDLIFVELGANDSTENAPLGDYDFVTSYANLSESNFRTAYIKGVKALESYYPDSKIILIITKMTDVYADSIKHIGHILGHEFIDARGYATEDDLHPNLQGMRDISSKVMYPFSKINNVDAALSTKVDINQGRANAGKALVIDEDGNVSTGEAGIPGAVKTALLNLLEHVAYTDGQGQSLYDALSAALGEDFYNKWNWSFGDGDFGIDVNNTGYNSTLKYLFRETADSNALIRRHADVSRGVHPFKIHVSGDVYEDGTIYPIPVPPRASKCRISMTPSSLQIGACIAKYSNGEWVLNVDTGWKPSPNEFYFDAEEGQVLAFSLRVDSNNSQFSTATEPTACTIEFEIDDWYDRLVWEWNGTDGDLIKQSRSSAYTTSDRQVYIGHPTTPNNMRKTFLTLRGRKECQFSNSGGASNYYLIPIPATANRVTISSTPSTNQVAPAIMRDTGDGFDQLIDFSWNSMPFTGSFTAGENLELRFSLRVSSSNPDFSSSTEPTSLRIEFSEV